MKIVCCAYREWGLNVVQALTGLFPEHDFPTCKNPDEFSIELTRNGQPDLILAIGWSWIFDKEIASAVWIVGAHPSDLPDYAGGSPIQNQILNGVTQTKNTLFRITPNIDEGPIVAKIPLSLEGHIEEIFKRLTYTSIVLYSDFIRSYPDNIQLIKQSRPDEHKTLRRLKPDSGKLTAEDFSKMSTRQLYDFIRCRESPYPNTYLEDEKGTLYFSRVEWVEKS